VPRSLLYALQALALALSANAAHAQLRVSSDFESGSARVLAIDDRTQTVRITPAGDPKRGMPSWWYLRLDGVDSKRPLTLEVVAQKATLPTSVPGKTQSLAPYWALPTQAAYSTDGKAWRQTTPGEVMDGGAVYRVDEVTTTLWLAWGPPFTATDAATFVEQAGKAHPFAKAFTLGESREGRVVPGLKIAEGDRPAARRPAVWIIARQHAWEIGGTWVGIGFVEWLLGDEADAVALRRNAEVFFVPVLDVDHVATGDGGKHAEPQDHHLDWTETPHWPEVAAAQQHLRDTADEGRLALFLDLHNPSPGAKLETFYVAHPPQVTEPVAALQERFLAGARDAFGEIRLLDTKPTAPEELEIWERNRQRGCLPWVRAHGNPHTVAFTIETPWNTSRGTSAGYRDAGEILARVTARYLRDSEAAGPLGRGLVAPSTD